MTIKVENLKRANNLYETWLKLRTIELILIQMRSNGLTKIDLKFEGHNLLEMKDLISLGLGENHIKDGIYDIILVLLDKQAILISSLLGECGVDVDPILAEREDYLNKASNHGNQTLA